MATKKKMIVAFALCDHSEGEGENALNLMEGQRLELPKAEFDKLAKKGIAVAGVFVKMKTAVEGGRYSLKPHDTTWLAPNVYEAWKGMGYCEPTDDDPKIADQMKARDEEARAALAERAVAVEARDLAQKEAAKMAGDLMQAALEMQAARAQAEKLRDMVQPDPESEDVLSDEMGDILTEIQALIDMIPDHIVVPEVDAAEGAEEGSQEPELKLD